MDDVWEHIASLQSAQEVWEHLMMLPEDLRLRFLQELIDTQAKHRKWFLEKDKRFREVNGVSRSWHHALTHPDYLERRREYGRRYYKKRKELQQQQAVET